MQDAIKSYILRERKKKNEEYMANEKIKEEMVNYWNKKKLSVY